jgi:hypothetical protein
MNTNEIRELTMDETDSVSGGLGFLAVAAFAAVMLHTAWVPEKSVIDIAKDYAQQKKDGKRPQ